jgi:hypothetical protein
LKLRSKMTCSWSLERDRSERIGLRGCRVTGWVKTEKPVVPGLTGYGTRLDRPPPLTQQVVLQA